MAVFCMILIQRVRRVENGYNKVGKIILEKSRIPFIIHVQMMWHVLAVAALLSTVFCLYDEDSAVFKLTASNFKKLVLDSDEYWMVQFYAPWCGHCKKAVPEYLQAAEILKGIVNFGAVDMTTDQQAGAKYNVQGYPTIKFFASDKANPIDFNSGDRTFDKFVDFSMTHVKKEVKDRLKKLDSESESDEL